MSGLFPTVISNMLGDVRERHAVREQAGAPLPALKPQLAPSAAPGAAQVPSSAPEPTPGTIPAAAALQVPARVPARSRSSIQVLAAFAFACLLSIAAFPDAWLGMVRVWMNSETFTHGFIALPCAAWMIWHRRSDWAAVERRTWWPALLLIAGCGLMWMLGHLAGVDSLAQFGAVAIIPATLLLLAGPAITRSLAFPLAFLFFAVPAGEFLTPIMMDYTADATVLALRWSGVPVYREGLHFMVPTGRWSVVEACSGLRYLIAALALGVLYAYLQFRTLKYRLRFMALAVLVPIIANWIRAYMIVMLGHLSNMKIATGVDHLVYGWLFFGMVMGLLFWIGSRWREPDAAPAGSTRAAATSPDRAVTDGAATSPMVTPMTTPIGAILVAALAAVLFVLPWRPVAAGLLDATVPVPVSASLRASLAVLPEAPELPFEPAWSGATESFRSSRLVDGEPVDVHAFYYARQHDGEEMIHSSNTTVRLEDRRWPTRSHHIEDTPQGPVESLRIGHRLSGDLLVWQWYAVGGAHTPSEYRAKAATIWSLLSGQGDHSVSVVLATPVTTDSAEALSAARQRLEQIAATIGPAISASAHGDVLAPR